MTTNTGTLYFIIVLLLSVLTISRPVLASDSKITVAAANSTCNVLQKIAPSFEKQHAITVEFICKSSGRLAKGIKGNAIKADLYISANQAWMDKMVKAGVVNAANVTTLWGNRLLAATPKGNRLSLGSWDELASDKVKTVMIGDPGTAPFGRYAKQALESTKLWDAVKGKIVTKRHITLLADTVAESPHGTVGILFATNINDGMKVVYELDSTWHKPILYYSSVVTSAQNPKGASAFMNHLHGDEARNILLQSGFTLLQP